MRKSNHSSQGFTLIAALLILVLLSGVAVGLLFMVGNETRMGGNDLEQNLSYYGAESGIEKLTADLSNLYQANLAPSDAQIQNLRFSPPTTAMVGPMNYAEAIVYPKDVNGNPVSQWNTISTGTNQGLYAEIVPMRLDVTASRPAGASVSISRRVEVALIPVFQFGVFCGYDCSYFAGPDFSFGGRVHTNGNLFLAAGNGRNLVFGDKISAYGQIVLDRLENGFLTAGNYGGTVSAPNAGGGCPMNTFPPPTANCNAMAATDASWTGGVPPLAGLANPNFYTTANTDYNGFLQNSTNGASNLQLPFVTNPCGPTNPPPTCNDPIQIIRKPLVGEAATSAMGTSRLYNKAQIRVLLADTQIELHRERGVIGDGQDLQLTGGQGGEPFGIANPAAVPPEPNWVAPLNSGGVSYGWATWPLLGEITTNPGAGGQAVWLRVEYLNQTTGLWVGATTQWLGYGFGRPFNTVPTTPFGGAGANGVDGSAILILQQMRPGQVNKTVSTNWYPINFYDTREGEMRDTTALGCSVNGIMNAVELDVGNLALWLKAQGPYTAGTGKAVNYTNQNGYVLYFSDRRGMLPDPNATNGGLTPPNTINGESGLEDVVNSTQGLNSNTPDGTLEGKTFYTYSPEDVDQNAVLDNWGAKNIGNGFGVNTNNLNPYQTTNCATSGLANAVTGARHVLKLVDGGMSGVGVSYLPTRWDNNNGGFTVASENPVYVQGNYNSSSADPFWLNNANNTTTHSAASIMADAVTVLSNQWNDQNSLNNPTALGNRSAGNAGQDTYYRMAVAGGKNIPFPQPNWAGKDFGTDGGLHNFLRYLEGWGNVNLWYNGSLVSMYYSEYNTGLFKCCTTVYGPPSRKYYFDTLFLNPANLPPATPVFQDVVNLNYHQNFAPQ